MSVAGALGTAKVLSENIGLLKATGDIATSLYKYATDYTAEVKDAANGAKIGDITQAYLNYDIRKWNGDINHPVLFVQMVKEAESETTQLVIGTIDFTKQTIQVVSFDKTYNGKVVVTQQCDLAGNEPVAQTVVESTKKEAATANDKAKTALNKEIADAAKAVASSRKGREINFSTANIMIPAAAMFQIYAGSKLGVLASDTLVNSTADAIGTQWTWGAARYRSMASSASGLTGGIIGAAATSWLTNQGIGFHRLAGTIVSAGVDSAAKGTLFWCRNILRGAEEQLATKIAIAEGNASQSLISTSYREGLYRKSEIDYDRVRELAINFKIEREPQGLLTSWHYLATTCMFSAVRSNHHNVQAAGLTGWQTAVWSDPLYRARQIERYRAGFSDVDSVADAQVVDAVDTAERGTVALVALAAAFLNNDGPARAAAQLLGAANWDTQWTAPRQSERGGRTSGYRMPNGKARSTAEAYDLEMYRVSKATSDPPNGDIINLFNFPRPGAARCVKFATTHSAVTPSEVMVQLVRNGSPRYAEVPLHSSHYARVSAIAALFESAVVALEVPDDGTGLQHSGTATRLNIAHTFVTLFADGNDTYFNTKWMYCTAADKSLEFERDRQRFVRALRCASGMPFTFIPSNA